MAELLTMLLTAVVTKVVDRLFDELVNDHPADPGHPVLDGRIPPVLCSIHRASMPRSRPMEGPAVPVVLSPAPRDRGRKVEEPPPSCPACARPLALHQPDPDRPDDLLGCCTHSPCGEWVILRRADGRTAVRQRIPREHRRPAPRPRSPFAATPAG